MYCPDISTLRGLIHASLEAEDMSLDFVPGHLLPDHHQDVAVLCFGSLPLTHALTLSPYRPDVSLSRALPLAFASSGILVSRSMWLAPTLWG